MTHWLPVVFWASTAALAWVYLGYPLLLRGLAGLRPVDWSTREPPPLRPVVVIACHNEASRIIGRLEALRHQDWAGPDLRVTVVADRCTDGTAGLVRGLGWVDVVEIERGPGGRASAHNAALAQTEADVVIFTDADTDFDHRFVTEILRPFSDPGVGCVVGRLSYRSGDSDIAASEAGYFAREIALRMDETSVGILATGTGACMAVRHSLFKPLAPTHDVDFVTPLDVVFAGYRVVMAPEAIAYDTPPDSIGREWRVRLRQTTRNLSGTVGRWWAARGWRFPVVTIGLLSHKVLRWMTGWLVLAQVVSGAFLWTDGWAYRFVVLPSGAVLVSGLAVVGLASVGVRTGRLAVLGTFVTAIAAMAIGCVAAVVGRARATYTPVAQAE